MPRWRRRSGEGRIWHITQRCHDRAFLLRFGCDRRCLTYWLREAVQRFELCVLDYIVTCNHIHLLVMDRGLGEIPRSMQLISGRTAQAYNHRKERRGAFWQGRYRPTAVESGRHLRRCLVYIDLNMVRAGAVSHPGQWAESGYHEIQRAARRYRIIDTTALTALCQLGGTSELRREHGEWVEQTLRRDECRRDPRWTEALAVGSRGFVDGFHAELGILGRHREVVADGEDFLLR